MNFFKIKVLSLFLFVFLIYSAAVKGAGMNDYCATPPFITRSVTPNVLIILDNSNSIDEDFYWNAVGSYSPSSKSVVAKEALRDFINQLKQKLRIGFMTYRLPSNVYKYHIHNSPYFVSYAPKSYCPNPPPECVEYCQTDNSSARSTCENQCQEQNSSFDVDYFDEIITHYSIGSEQRDRYCRLVYPKTQRMVNPTDTSNYMYYKHAYPMYSGSDLAEAFCYSTGYNPNEGSTYDS
jgi:hypothetical protein